MTFLPRIYERILEAINLPLIKYKILILMSPMLITMLGMPSGIT